jgi:hypothetical protein
LQSRPADRARRVVLSGMQGIEIETPSTPGCHQSQTDALDFLGRPQQPRDIIFVQSYPEEVQLCAFDVLAMGGDDCGICPSQCARPIWPRLLALRPMASSSATSNRARLGQSYSAKLASSGLKVCLTSLADAFHHSIEPPVLGVNLGVAITFFGRRGRIRSRHSRSV